MDKKAATMARENAAERNAEHYRNFQREFLEKIATGDPQPGMTRIQILEELMAKMNSDIKESNLKYVSDMISSLDEDDIIESKKENS